MTGLKFQTIPSGIGSDPYFLVGFRYDVSFSKQGHGLMARLFLCGNGMSANDLKR